MQASWVPLNDLSRAVAAELDGLREATERVFKSGWYVLGPEHNAFESELADYLGVARVLGVANGTDALELAVRATAPDPGSTVVTAANAGGYSTTAILRSGRQVRYADVSDASLCLTPETVQEALDDRVGAVIVTHLYGRAADVAGIRAVCAPRGVAIIEDCAQAIGARTDEGVVGSLGDAATFSFYPTKNLGALGDGGAVATPHADLAQAIRELRQYGWDRKYHVARAGGRNSRLDELQSAILRGRLRLVDAANARRREIIGRYAASAPRRVRVLPADGPYHVGHLAVVVADDRDALTEHLKSALVKTDVHYPIPDHRQPGFADHFSAPRLPVTERICDSVLSLPCFPELTENEIERVCSALESY